MKKNKPSRAISAKVSSEDLYGIHPVTEALRAGLRSCKALFLSDTENPRFSELVRLAMEKGIVPQACSMEQLTSMVSGAVHQGVVLRVSPFRFRDPDVLIRGDSPLVIVADGMEDPRNLGAIARTALCLGATGIVIPKDRAAGPTPAAVKASAGALEHLPLCQVVNITRFLEEGKKKGFWVAGLDGKGQPLPSAGLNGPLILVVGGEDRGVRPLVQKHCDVMVSIPQTGPVGSLNASVAAALAIYEIRRSSLVGFR
ncbi:23S rRNA (guanosine(2251)-2'-O)-methyltransferase RlmB [Desulfobotulus sp. H1]|uniref:23S rRNA (Guanosine(2251)-2'-O)-methyltransferase RlmB n=1 Tax=Desulfobotulus pelophilus TaxID=2823377 RepID=A0ABT3N9S2_9BACT|nr:23S rRNA (guanosine(2251)-2'-O)-methyltransferase RlmB [Desulfobotulus pelophilus]MCW7754185.1 23S rRNA (guanosine(2251)-2'-O)-methyltransferase RlmB [Desulfobotulus pelophilus]